ncbi:ABC transporter permease [Ornithinimicrobium faecis]|uniref:ABC transporter permease n=1 Tax=Ornithinimicrobium faecis TaxID=2934158 RepID=UPI002119688C|nr:ABC transporter permease [Ornithinimicrobium sp. HY1745]
MTQSISTARTRPATRGSSLLRIIVSRLVQAVLLLLAVIILNFLLIHLAPGDPATVIAGASGGATAEQLAQIRESYGLDDPVWVQLWHYIANILTFDLGYSFYFEESVAALILDRLWPTVLLAGTGMMAGLILGAALGIFAAIKPRGPLNYAVTILALVGFAAPVFWTAVLLILAFSIAVPIFPIQGMNSILAPDDFFPRLLDTAAHLALPATSLGLIYLALYSRTARTSMLEALESDYIRTAWAKGLSGKAVVLKHALRNAVMPVITLFGLQVGSLLSSVVLIEVVFNWPGLGSLLLESIVRRDTPVILGILLASSLLVIVANLLTDVAYRMIDPRISVGGSRHE